MRQKPENAGDTDAHTEGTHKRIDLSVPQVASSALAAVVAAKLASSFGVYGTILGAGLISVVATCGGSVLQHFFKRTGEQFREKRTVGAVRAGGRTAPAAAVPTGPAPGEFTEGTLHRARTTGWKRPVVAAALVFGIAMTGITSYELASGQNLGGGHSTTVGDALSGRNQSAVDSGESGSSDDGQDDQDSGGADETEDSGSGAGTPAATPSGSPGGTGDSTPSDGSTPDDGGTASSPTPTPDATGEEDAGETTSPAPDASATSPEPGARSRSGTAAPDQDGPAAP
ncbi:hypothetical protein ACVV2G_23320 [Streptomyces ziwulingensis]